MKNQNFLLKIILIVLCLHLLYTNAEILLSTIENGNAFQKILMCFFGMSYSLLTTISIYKLNKILPIVVFSFLDGFAVFMRIDDIKTAIFYGLYTSIIVIVSFAIKQKEIKENQIKTENNQNETKLNQIITKNNQNETKILELETKLNQTKTKILEYQNYIELSITRSLTKEKDPDEIKKKVLVKEFLDEDFKNQIITKLIQNLSKQNQIKSKNEQPILDIQ